jgi:hypothetical protein
MSLIFRSGSNYRKTGFINSVACVTVNIPQRKFGEELIIIGTSLGSLDAYLLKTFDRVWTISGCHDGIILKVSLSDTLIITCGRDKHICVINLNRGVVIRRFTSYHGLPTAIGLTDKTPEEVFMATNSVIVYKLTSVKFLQELLRSKLPVVSLVVTSIIMGTVLASTAKNVGQITTWYLLRVKRNESEKFPSAMLKMNTPSLHLAVQAKVDETVLMLIVNIDGKAFVWRLCMKKCFFVWIVVKLVLQHQCVLFQNRNIIMVKLLQESFGKLQRKINDFFIVKIHETLQ